MGRFQQFQKSIASKQHMPMKDAGAVLAAGARKASPAAKAANPNLAKVTGAMKPKKKKKKMPAKMKYRNMAKKMSASPNMAAQPSMGPGAPVNDSDNDGY